MGTLTIRNLDDDVKADLRVRAATNGRSMEEEARRIIGAALGRDADTSDNIVDAIRALVAPLGGIDVAVAPRGREQRPTPDFSGPDYRGVGPRRPPG